MSNMINWTVLEVSLHAVILKWIDDVSSNPEWEEVGYVGDNVAAHMTTAALSALKASADVQTYLSREGMLGNERTEP